MPFRTSDENTATVVSNEQRIALNENQNVSDSQRLDDIEDAMTDLTLITNRSILDLPPLP